MCFSVLRSELTMFLFLSFITYFHVVRTAEPLIIARIMQGNLSSEAYIVYTCFRQLVKFLML